MKNMSRSPASNFFLLPNEIFSLGLSAGEIASDEYFKRRLAANSRRFG